MSQNQFYFCKTRRNNVLLRRSKKLSMLFALMAVLAFSTICAAEIDQAMGVPTMTADEANMVNMAKENVQENGDAAAAANIVEPPTKESSTSTTSKTGFVDAFTASISVILFTELGDKTFFIAAIMAMRHPRLLVFSGAIGALALMTVLSVVFGMAATIIPKVYTYYISTALFAIFGLKMIYEGYFMKATDAQEEFEEVQSDLLKRDDELARSKRSKFDDSDSKRKNSNSDKEDNGNSGCVSSGNTAKSMSGTGNVEMKHRQRKQPNSNSNYDDKDSNSKSLADCKETDVFLDDHHREHIMLTTLKANNSNSSPALSGSMLSGQTMETNCSDENIASSSSSPFGKRNYNSKSNICDTQVLNNNNNNNKPRNNSLSGGSNSALNSMPSSSSINGLSNVSQKGSISINRNHHDSNLSISSSTAGQKMADGIVDSNGTIKRLERNSMLIQDPEKGMMRRNSKKSASYFATRIFMQAFTMTFLAEWGDRSQLTTIILAASKNVYGVIAGGILGHSICTGLAVIGGRMVAAKISVRTVTIVGGIVFLGFAVYALIVKPDDI